MELNRNRPDRYNQRGKKRHFKDGLDFWIRRDRLGEMRKLFKTWKLKPEKHYVFSIKGRYDQRWLYTLNPEAAVHAVVSFKDPSKALLFKLSWVEDKPSTADLSRNPLKVILPVIRRVMPSVIANDIIGVSPMTGPINQIHSLRMKYGTTPPSPTPSRSKLEKMLDDARSDLKEVLAASSSPNHSSSLIRPDETE